MLSCGSGYRGRVYRLWGTSTAFLLLILATCLASPGIASDPSNRRLDYIQRIIERYREDDRSHEQEFVDVLFLGSSSIHGWKTLQQDMVPLTVLNRGVNGIRIQEIVANADALILPHKFRALVLYAGENSMPLQDYSVEMLVESLQRLMKILQEAERDVPVFYISMKPSPKRAWHWEKMQRGNGLLEAYAKTQSRLSYVDVARDMLDSDGTVKPELFREDGLHLNDRGYLIWRNRLRPILLSALAGK